MAQELGNGVTNGAPQPAPQPNWDAGQSATPTAPDSVLYRLRTSQLFSQLSDAEFKEVMDLLRARNVDEGEILLAAGSDDTNLYIVRKGKLLIRSAEKNGHDPVIKFVGVGDVLNELTFVTGHLSDVTIETASPVQLWYIGRGEFQLLISRNDQLRDHLTYSQTELNFIRQSKRFDAQRPGELVLWFSRKHWWIFVRSQWFTALILVLIGVTFLPPLRPMFSGVLGTVFILVLLFFALVSFVWFVVDYLNDYYAITDQRVIHRERIFLIYDQQDEAPVGQVQNVSVNRPGFITTLLNVGNIAIETLGARANIQFEWVGKPDKVTKIILEQQARARVEIRASERSKVRTELRREMDVGAKPPSEEKKKEGKKKSAPLSQRVATGLTNMRNNVLPRLRLAREGEIIYRKHWLVLLGTTAVPFLSLLLYVAALVFIRINLPALSELLFGSFAVFAVLLVGLMLMFWVVWNYEDWRNDLYIVTADRLIDFKRSPFGLQGTTQKTAGLSSVQNVTATTKGFIDNLFNLGDVSIRTGGAENQLLFARVWNPRAVQREVVQRLEQFQADQRDVEAARRRREFIEWIGIYDELTRIHGQRPLS